MAAALTACAEETIPAALVESEQAPATTTVAPDPSACQQMRAESLPARLVAMSTQLVGSSETISADQLFASFAAGGLCGGCHGPTADQGGFQIQSVPDFKKSMTSAVLAHVLSDQTQPAPGAANDPMPPPGNSNSKPYSLRDANDPIKQWVGYVSQWLAAGSPDIFTPAGPTTGEGSNSTPSASGSFVMSSAIGDAMTNVGNCVPTPALIATESAKSAALDAMFAAATPLVQSPNGPGLTGQQMIGLPALLSQTDLVSFDSKILASYGVLAYAPGYPLWSDNAGKLRFVRVPRGTSIHFNKDTQQFDIPPNTRFYKTFMKQIVDTDGSIRWRKIETRLIVSRPDLVDELGNHTPMALFGSYHWRDDESEADLIVTTRNDLTPFPDTLLLYNTDEPLAANIVASTPTNTEQALLIAGAARHYAIPGSERCMECHMGSPAAAFVLGFTPLQIARRPVGVGGVIEEAGPDELTQLQRFVDYGLITGIESMADVLPLEASQGARTPRNAQELFAQGYMLGNCAHCHNPIGFPTVQNPVLKDVLNFLPGPTGGIFQFPLERVSPRIGRGLTGTTPIPYITPSLMDLPRFDTNHQIAPDKFMSGADDGSEPLLAAAYAPWRSLIYRNVDSAFAYTDDLALYPHMPFNTPGYDPRLKQILSDWMVSIPAVRKRPDLFEYAFYDESGASVVGPVDDSPQPYVEVTPDNPAYDAALLAAQKRLAILHTGVNPAFPPMATPYSRYADPDDTGDIIDPQVTNDPVCHPTPTLQGFSTFPGGTQYPFARHPSWVVTDLTSPPTWAPRRPDWNFVLVDRQPPAQAVSCAGSVSTDDEQAHQDQVDAIGFLQNIDLDSIRAFATTPVPFGLWQPQPGCNFASPSVQSASAWPAAAPLVGSFGDVSEPFGVRPHWMDVVAPAGDAPVYMQTPGQAVFKMICINCHGPLADSNGRLAQNLATMTGGLARVADFRDGLFGPQATNERDIQSEFGSINLPDAGLLDAGALLPGASDAAPVDATPPQWAGITADDVAARYVAWMALGGTSVRIPPDILQLVAATKVLDQSRFLTSVSANMLSSAKSLCLSLLGPGLYDLSGISETTPEVGGYLVDSIDLQTGQHRPQLNGSLLNANYDSELWLRLCTMNNPPPVHLVKYSAVGVSASRLQVQPAFQEGNSFDLSVNTPVASLAATASYPAGAPVGNDRGYCNPALDPSTQAACAVGVPNLWPWCVDTSTGNPASDGPAAQLANENGYPVCPPSVAAEPMTNDEGNAWAVRGAINAGLSVFLYVQWLETQTTAPPDFTQCNLLAQQ